MMKANIPLDQNLVKDTMLEVLKEKAVLALNDESYE